MQKYLGEPHEEDYHQDKNDKLHPKEDEPDLSPKLLLPLRLLVPLPIQAFA